MEIQPKAFATELMRMIAAKNGQRKRIMALKTRFRRNLGSLSRISCSMRPTPATRETSRQMVMAAMGIMTEFVRKSKKSSSCIPRIRTPASGP